MSINWFPPFAPRMGTLSPPGERPGARPPESEAPTPLRPTGPGRRAPVLRGGGRSPSTQLPPRLFERPTSVFVYGPSRPMVNLALFALAEATTPQFQWLDILPPGEERPTDDPVRLGWVRDDQLWVVETACEFQPDPLSADPPVFSLIRSDEPPTTVTELREFVRLPETSQRILATPPPSNGPGVVAVPNAHRVMAKFPAAQIPSLIHAHHSAGFSVYVGYAEGAGMGRTAFDFVFRLDGERPENWRSSRLSCEKGISAGPLRANRAVGLADLPLFASVFSRAFPSS